MGSRGTGNPTFVPSFLIFFFCLSLSVSPYIVTIPTVKSRNKIIPKDSHIGLLCFVIACKIEDRLRVGLYLLTHALTAPQKSNEEADVSAHIQVVLDDFRGISAMIVAWPSANQVVKVNDCVSSAQHKEHAESTLEG